ncbi:uncharacterized protein EI90DRAFT_3059206 [Cantharellus anzutake]|uniref:uncharacterized protein n=1 Tax=Cantharellus anzutake TaxID=1750568 RepID=UPI001905D326|nr:uncharacterized protein EI90DRAFT_3059206 [Cantharellus anzutake]KAF8330765.1 hypothetical protein EI90DRAFT_3059206 [Cantharellus anzutake]
MNDESRPLYRDQGKWNHAFREPEKIRKWNDVGGDTKGNEAIPDYQSPNTFHELFRNPAAAASWDRSVSLANGQPERTPAGPGPRIHENEAREVADRKLALQLALQDYETKREYDSLSAQYSPQEIFECSICMEAQPTEAAMSITTCKHVFCRMCLKFHVVARLEEGRHPIFCPICSADKNIDQKGEISITMAELLGLSERQFVMWEKLNLAQHSVWIDCPRCKRSSLVDRDDFQDSSELQCPLPTCRCVWCKKCMSQIDRAVGTHSCDGQAEMDRYIASGSATKRCPGCTTPTEKTGGCNHMTCSAPGCNTHFCWTCGKSIIRTRIQSQIQTAVEAHYGQCEFFHYN